MNRTLFLILALGAVCAGCGESAPPAGPDPSTRPWDTCGWDVWVAAGPREPRTSWNGRYVAFVLEVNGHGSKVVVVDTRLNSVDTIDVLNAVAGMYSIAYFNVFWCPYDEARLLIECGGGIDTVGDGRGRSVGRLWFMADIPADRIDNVTPAIYGRGASPVPFTVRQWLPSSVSGADSILFNAVVLALPSRLLIPSYDRRLVSPDGRVVSSNDDNVHYIGAAQVPIPPQPVVEFAWSRDARWCAVTSTMNYGGGLVYGVTILDLPSVTPVSHIALRRDCSFIATTADFCSDTSIVVGTRRIGDQRARLIECGLDGTVLRTLW